MRRLTVVLLACTLAAGCGPTPTPAPSPVPVLASPSAAAAQPATAAPATPAATSATPPPATAAPAPTDSPAPAPTAPPLAPKTHPRLWLTPADVDQYRSWAADGNPLWTDGLALLAERARAEMDEGRVPDQDCGNVGYEEYPTESYAQLFAFLSLVGPDPAVRESDAQRARTLLMHIMDLAAKGPAAEENVTCNESRQFPPFRHPDFATSDRDRARYHGETFPLVVDWIYPTLTAKDKATIKAVFLRWSEEIITRGYHHPEPVGVINDPALLADKQQLRFAGNNYYAAHARNLGLMALALDEADGGAEFRRYLDIVNGAYLYIFNELVRTDSRGGLLPEGFEYSPQTASYIAQLAWAMRTSQAAGADAAFEREFWNDFVDGYLHSISPGAREFDRDGDVFMEYQPAWYGDSQDYRLPDFINAFGALGHLLADRRSAIQWIAINTPPGGATRLADRVRNPTDFREAILAFMLLEPGAAPADPRPALALEFVAEGLNRVFSRTGWDPAATWLNYRLSWNSIDHQMADGNHFEWYRNGEWLTKGRTGYANIAEGIASSEFYNTVTIGNDRPVDRDDSDWRIDLWRRGSQWNLVSDGDPVLLAYGATPAYLHATGDATPLYNSTSEGSTAVAHASRTLVWVKPDLVFVYDRAESKAAGSEKRWWLQLASPATVRGKTATATTAGGQQLFVTAALPANATLSAVNETEQYVIDTLAHNEPMKVRLMSTVPGAPSAVQMLHVLEAADAGAAPAAVTPVRVESGAWDGAAAGGVAVLFARSVVGPPADFLSYTAPAGTRTHLVTGLTPGATYDVQVTAVADGVAVRITTGGSWTADGGGALLIEP